MMYTCLIKATVDREKPRYLGLRLVNELSITQPVLFGLTCGCRHTKWISNDVLCVVRPAARVPVSSLSLLSAKKRGKQNKEYWLKPVNRIVSEGKPMNI